MSRCEHETRRVSAQRQPEGWVKITCERCGDVEKLDIREEMGIPDPRNRPMVLEET